MRIPRIEHRAKERRADDADEDAAAAFAAKEAEVLARHGTRARAFDVTLPMDPPLDAHVLEAGDGDPVLLLHGGGGVAVSWEPLLGRLARGRRVLAPDRPGCGLTAKVAYVGVDLRAHAARFVEAAMDALGLERAPIVANSMGGYWALLFALARPERVERIVLVGAPTGTHWFAPVPILVQAVPGVNRAAHAALMARGVAGTREEFRQLLVAHLERVDPAIVEAWHLGRRVPGAAESWLTLLEETFTPIGLRPRHFVRDELAALDVPLRLVWGRRDAFAPPFVAEEIRRAAPDARVDVVEDAGHMPWLDRPDEVARLVEDALA